MKGMQRIQQNRNRCGYLLEESGENVISMLVLGPITLSIKLGEGSLKTEKDIPILLIINALNRTQKSLFEKCNSYIVIPGIPLFGIRYDTYFFFQSEKTHYTPN